MAADEGLVASLLRLTQGGFRLEEGALTMECGKAGELETAETVIASSESCVNSLDGRQ